MIKNTILEFIQTFSVWKKQLYPRFIYSNQLDFSPIFVYHQIDTKQFSQHLDYLDTNQYRSLHPDELFTHLTTSNREMEKVVVLTFDDGFSNLYDVVFPLLKKYNQKVVAFISPGRIENPNYLSWAQVKEMHVSGFVDFQSHGFLHERIFVSNKIIDFFEPNTIYPFSGDVPFYNFDQKLRIDIKRTPGLPIFQNTSRFSSAPQIFPDSQIVDICTETIQSYGEENFFKIKSWKTILRKSIDSKRNILKEAVCETHQEQANAIRSEIINSQKAIESKLANKRIRHFAYPWFEKSELTENILKESGFSSSFIGLFGINASPSESQFPWSLKRLNGDFVPALPGIHRKNFFRIIFGKMLRRFLLNTKWFSVLLL